MKWLLEGNTLLLAQAASTWFLVGLIWMVQIVHYPLFANVGEEEFEAYHVLHAERITWIVGPTMIIELMTAILLVTLQRPSGSMDTFWAWTGLGLVVFIWLTTAFVSVPLHGKLGAGFAVGPHWWLVATNWLRTFAWTARGAIALVMLKGLNG